MDSSMEVEVQFRDVCQCEELFGQHRSDESLLIGGALFQSLRDAQEVCLLDVADVFPSSGLSSPQVLSSDGTAGPDAFCNTTRFDARHHAAQKLEVIHRDPLRVLDKLGSLTLQIHRELIRFRHEVELGQWTQRDLLTQITTSQLHAQSSSDDRHSQVSAYTVRQSHEGSISPCFFRDGDGLGTTPVDVVPHSTVRTEATSQSDSRHNTWRMSVHSAFEVAMLATQTTRAIDVLAKNMHLPGNASSAYDRMLQSWSEKSLLFTRRRLRLDGLRRLVEHNCFQTVIFLLILANSLLIGVAAHCAITESFDAYDARSQGLVPPPGRLGWARTCEEVFAVTFSAEMVLRLLAHEGEYFRSLWNTGELCAVVSTTLSTFSPNPTLGKIADAMVVLRFVRPERLLLAVGFLRYAPRAGGVHLRLLVLACKTSIGALCWSTVLLVCLLLLSSIVFVQGARTYIDDASPSDPFVEDLREHFRSMPITMLTLFVCLLGEADFKAIINVLRMVGHWYLVLFVALLLFLTLSVTNVIAGVFVSDAILVAKNDREITMREQMLEARQNMNDLYNLWFMLDVNNHQSLKRDQFREQMRRPEVKQVFAKFKLDATDVDAFFNLMDADQTGEVDVEEFIVGCMRVKGMSNEVDTGITVQETKMLAKRIHRAMKTIQRQSASVQSELQHLSGRVGSLESVGGLEV